MAAALISGSSGPVGSPPDDILAELAATDGS
jgi:hypothetical protein